MSCFWGLRQALWAPQGAKGLFGPLGEPMGLCGPLGSKGPCGQPRNLEAQTQKLEAQTQKPRNPEVLQFQECGVAAGGLTGQKC